MPNRLLDTNVLIAHFRGLHPYQEASPSVASNHAQELISKLNTDAIVTPVEIEMLAGARNRHEIELTEAFLKPFRLIDRRRILAEDWEEARRVSKYLPKQVHSSSRRKTRSEPNVQPRDLGDCLITAIARRLNYDVLTDDKGLIRQAGRTRRRKP
jgi:predicted nucleic acid-binding protein